MNIGFLDHHKRDIGTLELALLCRPVQKKVFSRAKPRFFKLRGNKLRYYTNDTVAQVIVWRGTPISADIVVSPILCKL